MTAAVAAPLARPLFAALETDRLVLRRHQARDRSALTRLLADREVVRWLAEVPDPYTETDAEDWIHACRRGWATGYDYQFVITDRATGRIVGNIGLKRLSPPGGPEIGAAELGYWLGQAHWGRGIGREAARAVIGFGFGSIGFERLEAVCMDTNRRSRALLEGLGFRQRGQRPQRFFTDTEPTEAPLFELTRTAWRP